MNQGVKLFVSRVIFDLITDATWQMELATLVNGRCLSLSRSTFSLPKSKNPTETNGLVSVVFAMLMCDNDFPGSQEAHQVEEALYSFIRQER